MRLTDARARSTAVSALNVRILLSLVLAERCIAKQQRPRCRRWVKGRRAQCEHNESASPLKADMPAERCDDAMRRTCPGLLTNWWTGDNRLPVVERLR